MDIKIEKQPKSTVILTIEINPKEYTSFLDTSAKELSKEINIKGFRPGQAPLDIIKQKIGTAEIMNHALNNIITHTFVKAIKEKGLNTIGNPEINIKKMAPENNLIYTARVALLPKIKLGNIDSITIKKTPVKIENEEIEHTLEHIARSRATQTETDSPAKNKNLVKLDYNISIDNVPQEAGQQKDFELYLGDSHMIPGFEEQIIGLKSGQTKKFDIKFPDDYFQKNFAGKMCTFDIKINGVYNLNIPPIDNNLAKNLGKFKNLTELKAHIKQNLEQEKTVKAEKKLEQKILEKIIAKTTFDEFPDILINNEVESIIQELEQDLTSRGLDIQTWLTNINKTMEEFKKDLQPQAITRVQSALIIKTFATQEKITINQEKIEEEIKKLSKYYQDNQELIKQFKTEQYRQHLINILTAQTAMDKLKNKIIK